MRRLWTLLCCAAALLAWLCHRHRCGSLYATYSDGDGFVWFDCIACGMPVKTRVRDGAVRLPSPRAEAEMVLVRLEQQHERAVADCRAAAGLGAAYRRDRAKHERMGPREARNA